MDRVNEENKQLTDHNHILNKHYVAFDALQMKVSELLVRIVMLSTEVESLRVRVRDKEKENEEIRRSSLAPFRNK